MEFAHGNKFQHKILHIKIIHNCEYANPIDKVEKLKKRKLIKEKQQNCKPLAYSITKNKLGITYIMTLSTFSAFGFLLNLRQLKTKANSSKTMKIKMMHISIQISKKLT